MIQKLYFGDFWVLEWFKVKLLHLRRFEPIFIALGGVNVEIGIIYPFRRASKAPSVDRVINQPGV